VPATRPSAWCSAGDARVASYVRLDLTARRPA
jgi:hypothetical protein